MELNQKDFSAMIFYGFKSSITSQDHYMVKFVKANPKLWYGEKCDYILSDF